MDNSDKNMRKKKDRRGSHIRTYTDEELLNSLKNFCLKNGRIPTKGDLTNNPEYPSFSTYKRRFKTWNNALKNIDETHIENKDYKTQIT